MSKIATGFFISLFLALPLLSFSAVFAKDGSFSARPNAGKIYEKREEIKEDILEKKTEIREKRATHIKEKFSLVLKRYVAADERLDKISEKIQTRINKFKDRGIDVTSAQTALDSCDTNDAAVANAILIATSSVEALDPSSEDIRSQVDAAHNSLKNVRQALRNYHKCLRSTLPIIGSIAPNKEATEDAN